MLSFETIHEPTLYHDHTLCITHSNDNSHINILLRIIVVSVKNRIEILCSGLDNMNVRVCMYVREREREIETQGV